MELREFRGRDPNYVVLERLGQGGFGTVYKAKRKRDGQILAKKIVHRNRNTLESIRAEMEALTRLRGCRNVVEWSNDVAYDTLNNEVHLHMRYYSMGDLSKAISQHRSARKKFLEIEVLDIFLDLVDALADCHRNGILHRDIKPANILLGSIKTRKGGYRKRLGAFLADFGVGKVTMGAIMPMTLQASTLMGTNPYIAPEALKRETGPESDVFSLGCVMYEMCELRPAFDGLRKNSVPTMTSGYSHSIKDAILRSMSLNKYARPSLAALSSRLRLWITAELEAAPPGKPIMNGAPYIPPVFKASSKKLKTRFGKGEKRTVRSKPESTLSYLCTVM